MGMMLFFAALLGLITGAIAQSKGHSFFVWWLFGTALFIVALPCAIILKPNREAQEADAISNGDMKKCPACAELVKREALKCRFCGSEVAPA